MGTLEAVLTNEAVLTSIPKRRVQRKMISVDNFFVFWRLLFFGFVVAIWT